MQVLLTGHNGELTDLYLEALRSFRQWNSTARIVCYSNFKPQERRLFAPLCVELPKADRLRFQRLGCGFYLEPAFAELLHDGDEAISCDLDLLFGADPFKVFHKPFDVFYTTRHYDYHYPVNGGVRGFRVNERSRRFIAFHAGQLERPTWEPFLSYIHQSQQPEIFLRDQHLFCTIHQCLQSLPPEIRGVDFHDAGPTMNYCPDYDWRGYTALLDLVHAMKRRKAVVYHLKGRMKEAITAAEAGAVLAGGAVPARFYQLFALQKARGMTARLARLARTPRRSRVT